MMRYDVMMMMVMLMMMMTMMILMMMIMMMMMMMMMCFLRRYFVTEWSKTHGHNSNVTISSGVHMKLCASNNEGATAYVHI